MIGLALSGGGSRAMAFHLGCLRALNDLEILQDVGVLSTISGGSVIGAYYAYTPQKSFEEFERDIRGFLRTGFQGKIMVELLKPQNLLACGSSFCATRIDGGIAHLLKREPVLQRFPSRSDLFCNILKSDIFPSLKMDSHRRKDLQVVIGACELRTGTAFRFGNSKSGGWRHGQIVSEGIDVAFAVAASAAFPILLPTLDRTFLFDKKGQQQKHRVVLTDGGVYDNLGLQVLEPGRDSNFSLHNFPCDFLIACNAGHGQDSGKEVPWGFLTRVKRSFEVVHRRVQDSTMHRLHHLKSSGSIKGFVLPYLGQQDNSLPWKPSMLVPREDVMSYPTDFAAMPEVWIEKLSNRGEQLTRALVSYYLSDLIS